MTSVSYRITVDEFCWSQDQQRHRATARQYEKGELLPPLILVGIGSNYRTDKSNRSLLGHSFGGYFSLYALLSQVQTNRNDFKNFVAASPSLWYNNFYLNQLAGLLKSKNAKDSLSVFMSVGGLEDSTWSISPVKN